MKLEKDLWRELKRIKSKICWTRLENRGLTLTRDNYIRRQMRLSDKVEKDEKASKTVGHETLIGKAGGLLNGYINESSNQVNIAESMKRINELKEIQKDRLKNLIIDGESQDINEF